MEYRRLGRSGLKISALSFGAWVTFSYQLNEESAGKCMKVAYDAGVNFFDNAEAYADGEAERIMGSVLRKMGWRRDTYCVSSKAYWGGDRPTQKGLSRKHIHDSCNAALRRLQVDYLDLFFCHRPDPHTPIEETVRAMGDLVRQGKVLYWGTSEWSADQIAHAWGAARELHVAPPTMEQPQYNLLHRDKVEREFRHLFDEIGLGLTTWSPLASGVLTGKYDRGIPKDSRMNLPGYEWLRARVESEEGRAMIAKARKIRPVADALEIPLGRLAIAWCLKNPRVSSVILGASRVEQLRENLKALEAVPLLTDEVMDQLDRVLGNRPEPPQEF